MSAALLLAAGIGGGGLLIAAGSAVILFERTTARRLRLLDRFSGGGARQVINITSLRRDRRFDETFRAAMLVPGKVRDTLREAGPTLLSISVVAAILTTVVLHVLLEIRYSFTTMIGGMLGAALLLLVLRMRHKRRLAAIEEKVPQALEMMVRTLRVGLPVTRAIAIVGAELEGPLGKEFQEASFQISYGKDIVVALKDLAQRCSSQNMAFLATVVAMQQATGGNLAEVLERLAAIARGRQQMQRKIAAATAEAQWSGRFLSAFPLISTGVLLAINPNYFAEISDKPFFPKILVVVGVLLVMNVLFMRRMLRIG